MPKIKTSKSVAKRIDRLTAGGKVMGRKMSAQHRARFKSKRTKRNSSQELVFSKGFAKKLLNLVNG